MREWPGDSRSPIRPGCRARDLPGGAADRRGIRAPALSRRPAAPHPVGKRPQGRGLYLRHTRPPRQDRRRRGALVHRSRRADLQPGRHQPAGARIRHAGTAHGDRRGRDQGHRAAPVPGRLLVHGHGGDHGRPASSGGLGLRQLQATALHRPVAQALQPLARLLIHGQAGQGRRRPLPLTVRARGSSRLRVPAAASGRPPTSSSCASSSSKSTREVDARCSAHRSRAAASSSASRLGQGRSTPGPAASRSRSPRRRDSTSSPAATSASSPRPTAWTSRCSSPATALPACGSRPAATRSVSRPPADSRRSAPSADHNQRRPVIISTSSSALVSDRWRTPTCLPRRRTQIRSARRNTCSRRRGHVVLPAESGMRLVSSGSS